MAVELKLYDIKIEYVRSKGVKVVWDFRREIPLLNVIASPISEKWNKRVEEELRVFQIWKKFNPTIPFENLRQSPYSNKEFFVDVDIRKLFGESFSKKKIVLSLLIPWRYPHSMPEIDYQKNKEFWHILARWTNNHPFCMPPIMSQWWWSKRGRAGIAHYLKILMFFVTLAGRKRRDVNVQLKKLFFES